MTVPGWQAHRPAKAPSVPAWLADLEPLTTGMLAQDGLKLWCSDRSRAALGIRAGGVVYPVFPDAPDPSVDTGARVILDRLAASWCVMGPKVWVDRAEALLPASKVTHRVHYDFLVRPSHIPVLPPGPEDLRPGREEDAEALFVLQEGYEKEEVLFEPAEFQPLVSRLHFWKLLRQQEILALWEEGKPVAKAGTNALTSRWAQLGGVYTRPGRRGKGLQKRLMSGLLARLSAQGRGACLFVKKDNVPAGALYRCLGFVPAADFTILYGERRPSVPGFLSIPGRRG